MARDFPAQFGRAPQYQNPDGTLPLPTAKNIPVPLWTQTRVPFQWTGPVAVGPSLPPEGVAPPPPSFDFTFTWDSPIFDLRPDLRSGQAGPKNGVPIWNTAGRLYLQLFGLTLTSPSPFVNPGVIPGAAGLTARSVDQGNTLFAFITSPAVPDPAGQVPYNSVVNIGPPETITNSFIFPTGQPDSAVVGFAPPGTNLGAGEGYPIRYWRVQVTFTKRFTPTEETGDWPPGAWPNNPPSDLRPPQFSLQAAYY